MLQVIIVEDEKHSRETLKNLISEFCDGVEVIGMSGSVDDAVELIKLKKPDLVFMDIELQTGTGFDVLDRLSNQQFEVIFTTAYEQYAIKAIKFSSIDYLLKPIDIEELQAAVKKALIKKDAGQYQQQLEVLLANFRKPSSEHKNICLSTADGIEFVKVHDVIFCEANGSYTNFYLKEGRKIIVSKHLKEYENLLADQDFMRVHNSFLINLMEVKRYVKTDGGYVLMNNDATVSISPKKKEEFMEKMSSLV